MQCTVSPPDLATYQKCPSSTSLPSNKTNISETLLVKNDMGHQCLNLHFMHFQLRLRLIKLFLPSFAQFHLSRKSAAARPLAFQIVSGNCDLIDQPQQPKFHIIMFN